MQLNIFQSVVPLLKEKKFNIDFDAFLNYMGQYHSNEWIYPDAVHRELGIAIKEIYVEQYLQIFFSVCQRFSGNIFKTVLEIPEFVNCVHCDSEIENPLQHAIIIYKVL